MDENEKAMRDPTDALVNIRKRSRKTTNAVMVIVVAEAVAIISIINVSAVACSVHGGEMQRKDDGREWKGRREGAEIYLYCCCHYVRWYLGITLPYH